MAQQPRWQPSSHFNYFLISDTWHPSLRNCSYCIVSTHLWHRSIFSYRLVSNSLYPLLNCICDMGHNWKKRNMKLIYVIQTRALDTPAYAHPSPCPPLPYSPLPGTVRLPSDWLSFQILSSEHLQVWSRPAFQNFVLASGSFLGLRRSINMAFTRISLNFHRDCLC
jgi:hypothetical protein